MSKNLFKDFIQTEWEASDNGSAKPGSSLVELSSWGILAIEGGDSKSFLQGQLSCDMDAVTSSNAQLGACINLKGRIIGNFIVCEIEHEESYYLLCPPDTIDLVNKTLQKYALFSNVKLNVLNDSKAIFASNSSTVPESAQNFSLSAIKESIVIADAEDAIQHCKSNASQISHADHFLQTCIDQGLAFIEPGTSEQFTPQEINFDLVEGVNFTKGCYTGQEVVARLHYRGKAKRRLFLAQIDDLAKKIEVGQQILNDSDKEQGHLVSLLSEPIGTHNALISININAALSFIENPTQALAMLKIEGVSIASISEPPYPWQSE